MLRAELATLLRQHRIQHRLGGTGHATRSPSRPPWNKREALGQQISRYRHGVLVWCLQAVRAANPRINLQGTTGRRRGPAEELRHRLTRAVDASTAGHPPLRELTTEQEFPIVETWRRAARAAALGEHDFDAGLGYGRLTEAAMPDRPQGRRRDHPRPGRPRPTLRRHSRLEEAPKPGAARPRGRRLHSLRGKRRTRLHRRPARLAPTRHHRRRTSRTRHRRAYSKPNTTCSST